MATNSCDEAVRRNDESGVRSAIWGDALKRVVSVTGFIKRCHARREFEERWSEE
jgi:hypothetical protein